MSNSLIKTSLIPAELQKAGYTHCFVYQGPSMRASFRAGNLLYVRPEGDMLQPGDVIVFTDENRLKPIVHRIIAITPEGYITRGDSNNRIDPFPIHKKQVIGKVGLVGERSYLRPVKNGRKGLLHAKALYAVSRFREGIKKILWAPYKLLLKKDWVAQVWRPKIIKIEIRTPQGVVVKYCLGKKTVATWDPLRREFRCKKPFDLVIQPPEDPKR